MMQTAQRRAARAAPATLLCISMACASVIAHAQVSAEEAETLVPKGANDDDVEARTAQAAALYDEATAAYVGAEYARAAENFLEADALLPSSEALTSAIAAARQARAHALVAKASMRAIAREAEDPELAARARAALLEAEVHLAKLRATCAPEPCVVFLNRKPLHESRLYLDPGSYRLNAQAGTTEQWVHPPPATIDFVAEAGLEYEFTLDVSSRKLALPAPVLDPTDRSRAPDARTERTSSPRQSAQRTLPAWTFYAGTGVTGVLALLTTWSGFDTLAAEDELPSRSNENYEDAENGVYRRAERTDWLLGATLVTGAATAALGVWWVDFDVGSDDEGRSATLPKGATLNVSGSFQ